MNAFCTRIIKDIDYVGGTFPDLIVFFLFIFYIIVRMKISTRKITVSLVTYADKK